MSDIYSYFDNWSDEDKKIYQDSSDRKVLEEVNISSGGKGYLFFSIILLAYSISSFIFLNKPIKDGKVPEKYTKLVDTGYYSCISAMAFSSLIIIYPLLRGVFTTYFPESTKAEWSLDIEFNKGVSVIIYLLILQITITNTLISGFFLKDSDSKLNLKIWLPILIILSLLLIFVPVALIIFGYNDKRKYEKCLEYIGYVKNREIDKHEGHYSDCQDYIIKYENENKLREKEKKKGEKERDKKQKKEQKEKIKKLKEKGEAKYGNIEGNIEPEAEYNLNKPGIYDEYSIGGFNQPFDIFGDYLSGYRPSEDSKIGKLGTGTKPRKYESKEREVKFNKYQSATRLNLESPLSNLGSNALNLTDRSDRTTHITINKKISRGENGIDHKHDHKHDNSLEEMDKTLGNMGKNISELNDIFDNENNGASKSLDKSLVSIDEIDEMMRDVLGYSSVDLR